jgi:hypothetical protein
MNSTEKAVLDLDASLFEKTSEKLLCPLFFPFFLKQLLIHHSDHLINKLKGFSIWFYSAILFGVEHFLQFEDFLSEAPY